MFTLSEFDYTKSKNENNSLDCIRKLIIRGEAAISLFSPLCENFVPMTICARCANLPGNDTCSNMKNSFAIETERLSDIYRVLTGARFALLADQLSPS